MSDYIDSASYSAALARCETLTRCMEEGCLSAIFEGLTHRAALVRINGIINATRFSVKTPEVIDIIKNLKNDSITFDTYAVSDFATAALDIMGVEKYNGDRKQIVDLIGSRFDF